MWEGPERWAGPELQWDIVYQLLKCDMGYLLLLLYFRHNRQLVKMFFIKQDHYEWVTVISTEERTHILDEAEV